jgi:hypothetical protein
MRLKNKHQVFMSTVVSANMIYRYKNWQITTRLKKVVKGRHWLTKDYFYPTPKNTFTHIK